MHGPLAHLHYCPLEAEPKERADGLQIFLKARKRCCLWQLDWRGVGGGCGENPQMKIEGRMEGQKIYTFYINLEMSSILKINIFPEIF